MHSRHRFSAAEFHPPVLVHAGPRLGIGQVDTHLKGPHQLPARAPHATREDGDFESEDGSSAEGVGVKVESGGGGGGFRWGGGGEGEEGCLGEEVFDFEFCVAWGGGRVDAGAGGSGGVGEVER